MFFMDIVNASHSYATGGTSVSEFWYYYHYLTFRVWFIFNMCSLVFNSNRELEMIYI